MLTSCIQGVHKGVQKALAADNLALVDADDPVFKLGGVTDTVNAAHAGHYNNIAAAAEQFGGGLQAQFVELFIDTKVFLNISIAYAAYRPRADSNRNNLQNTPPRFRERIV